MKTRINRKKSKKANELFLFSDTEMAGGRTIRKRRSDDCEQFTDAVVEVLQILERLDKPTINRIAEECYYNSLDCDIFNKKVIFLRSLPGYFFDIIQYTALEFCVQQVATPFYRWHTFMPEEHYEKGMQLYKQLCNDTKKERAMQKAIAQLFVEGAQHPCQRAAYLAIRWNAEYNIFRQRTCFYRQNTVSL